MNEIIKNSLWEIIIAAIMGFVVGYTVGGMSVNRLDVNHDGRADIRDLSVLAEEINKLSNGQTTLHP